MNEKSITSISGYVFLVVALACAALGVYLITHLNEGGGLVLPVLLLLAAVFIFKGLCIVYPNQGVAATFFGDYVGTLKKTGLLWINPLYKTEGISLRARNLNGQTLKVNDKMGNPIEIAAVVVWRVVDTAKALYDVDSYVQFVQIQAEAAVRSLAGSYAYDHMEDETSSITLRDSTGQINEYLEEQLNERLARAGVEVHEARISHLAYSPEIAGAMLQRQQATAVVAARKQIVEGAVGMVEMALARLAEKDVVHLDEERKAAMVSNLLVVLCAEKSVNPVVNAGSIY
ncbi:SPFH domain-containing protein [Fibrivirga algicola]|uniref:SPFH domain-containing protein n=1 Tax=Fibrivirga algicola TaxID=2950420 RepID=A0ABX0QSN4_9BACT|nr:SPFH domain-containing protein [Fibrivirga algicola]ARK11295.1 band 7 protein [Fibrella sp. ES10-3-2-2]NID13169.1 SPFH domain-containing protein [Fibrivirga algicola]